MADGRIESHERLSATEAFRWKPELSTEGPLSIIISRADKRLVVIRNGIEIGRCKVGFVNETDSIGTIIYVANSNMIETSKATTVNKEFKWKTFPVTDLHYGSERTIIQRDQMGRVRIPDAFLINLKPLVEEGTTLMITDAPILNNTTGVKMTILTSSHLTK
jgi:hypothetical protein